MKGIAIVAMIIGHIPEMPDSAIRFIYSFHMPLFFLIAGYYSKISNDHRQYIMKSAKRLLIPYAFVICLTAVYGFLSTLPIHKWNEAPLILASGIYASSSEHHSMFMARVRPVNAMWFLFALFWCRITYNYVLSKYDTLRSVLIISCISIVATMIDFYIINLPMAILPGLSAMMFYMIGFFYKKFRFEKWMIYVAFFCIFLYFVSLYNFRLSMDTCAYSNYPICVLGACGGTLLVMYISSLIKSINFIKLPLLWCGRLSMIILCCHTLERNFHLIEVFAIPNDLLYIIIYRVVMPVLLTWACTRLYFTKKIFQI